MEMENGKRNREKRIKNRKEKVNQDKTDFNGLKKYYKEKDWSDIQLTNGAENE